MLLATSKTIREATKLIQSTKGQFFSAAWITNDGRRKEGLFKLGVKKYVTGRGMKYKPSEHNVIPAWEIGKNKEADAYRCINVKTLKYLKIDNFEYFF